jgi:hypothetical protein
MRSLSGEYRRCTMFVIYDALSVVFMRKSKSLIVTSHKKFLLAILLALFISFSGLIITIFFGLEFK